MDSDAILKPFRKCSLLSEDIKIIEKDFGQETLKSLLPHRDPFLLLDSITGISLEKALIRGERFLDPSDPVFSGHFPDFPVYPGSLQLEMIGQLGLCLYDFLDRNSSDVSEQTKPVNVRATRILGAYFLQPLLPGKPVTVLAQKHSQDTWFGTALGQTIQDNKICCVSLSEVCFLD